MKIYSDLSFFAERTGIRSLSQIQSRQGNVKLSEIADKFMEKQQTALKDRMTISEEGIDYIREQLSDMKTEARSASQSRSGLTPISPGEISAEDKQYAAYIMLHSDSVDEEGVSRNLYLDINQGYLKEMENRNPQNWEDHMEALAKAYTEARQRITKGYEDGTRNVWIRDDGDGEDFEGIELDIDGQTVRYRKLTREEEIALLDKSIDKFTERVAAWYAGIEVRDTAELEKEPEKDEDLEALKKVINGLVDEARNLLDKVREEIAKLEKMSQKEIDFEGRMEAEAYSHRAETVERGKQQIQNENYKKMSQMVSDVMTLWGNVRA